jgi:fimbrial chaperone protein
VAALQITRLLACACVLLLATGTADAFRLSPMRYVLEPSGSGAEITLRLENTFAVDLPVEVEVYKRTVDEAGKELRTSGEADFLVFPPQSLVPVGAEQAFRVRYIGPQNITDMQSYVVVVRQLSIRDPQAGSGVEVMLALGTAAYVSPPGAEANLSISLADESSTSGKATVWVQNAGNAYGYVDRFDIALTSADGASVTVPSSAFATDLESPLIMPGSRRKLEVPVPEALAGHPLVSASIAEAGD